MKKILYITTVSLTLNTFLIPHIRHLINHGFSVNIASNIDVPLSEEFQQLGVKHYLIPFSRNPLSPQNLQAFSEIIKLQRENNYEAVHVHTPVAAFITRAALRNFKVKIVYTAHGFHFYKKAPAINWLLYYPIERVAAKWTDTIITINEEDFQRAKTFKLRNKGQVFKIPGVGIEEEDYELSSFNRSRFRKTLGLKKEDFALLVLAELNKNKNHIQVIRAINELKEKCPHIKVLCAGKGHKEKELKRFVNHFNLQGKVRFLGYRRDVRELIYSSDCIGLFSLREGLGKCLLEGMIMGKPVIATDTRGPRELIAPGENGYLVKVKDYKDLAQYLEKLYKDKALQQRFGESSKEKVKDFSLDNVLKEVINFY